MRRGGSGLQITLIDGRVVTAGTLQTGLWRRRSGRPDRAEEALSAITRAMEAARSARPAETAAAMEAAAPLLAKRAVRRLALLVVAGPAILIASFLVPGEGVNVDGRLRWLGIACTLGSLGAAYTLLRLAQPGRARAGQRRRKR